MGYYDKEVNRTDKAGDKRMIQGGFEPEVDNAKNVNRDYFGSDAYCEGEGFLGVDDLDRLRRDKLKHETK